MKRFLILCEGVTDQLFIADCIFEIYNLKGYKKPKKSNHYEFDIQYNDGSRIVSVGGCEKLNTSLYKSIIDDNNFNNGITLVVFDADKPGFGNNGFDSCSQKMKDLIDSQYYSFEYYLWPNNVSDGKFENLLRHLVPKDNEPIFECIESHQLCLQSIGGKNLRIATIKEVINFYVYTMGFESAPHKRNYDFRELWNFSFDSNEILKQFKLFLEKNLN